MKKILFLLLAMVAITASASKKDNAPAPKKALVLYYSQTGATKTLAEEIQKQLGADIEEIKAVKPYEGDFGATIARCQKEMSEGVLPEIETLKSKIEDYDVVFLGYPIWFGKAAPPALAFVKQHDLSKVKLVPFCTFGSGGKETGAKSLDEVSAGKLNYDALYGLRNARIKNAPAEVEYFLKSNGYLEGEYEKKAEFPQAQPVGEAETSLFNKACGSYPMLRATPKSFSKRTTNAGTEYLFEAADSAQNGPQTIKIIVVVPNDSTVAPEFTEVIR